MADRGDMFGKVDIWIQADQVFFSDLDNSIAWKIGDVDNNFEIARLQLIDDIPCSC